jgi:monothiol glutaredoxin
MPRAVLAESNIHPAIRAQVTNHESAIVREVQAAVAAHPVVVVGMAINPYPKKARKWLDEAKVPHHYISYGSYFSMWRQRNALKMWTGWPTMPMVFVRGVLVGGADDVKKLIVSGELQRMLADKSAQR